MAISTTFWLAIRAYHNNVYQMRCHNVECNEGSHSDQYTVKPLDIEISKGQHFCPLVNEKFRGENIRKIQLMHQLLFIVGGSPLLSDSTIDRFYCNKLFKMSSNNSCSQG